MGICITVSGLLTVKVCGPIAMNVSGTLKDVGLTYAGFIFFNDATASLNVAVGLACSFTGASYIIYDKY